jgi:hypothetical protein
VWPQHLAQNGAIAEAVEVGIDLVKGDVPETQFPHRQSATPMRRDETRNVEVWGTAKIISLTAIMPGSVRFPGNAIVSVTKCDRDLYLWTKNC